MVEVESFTIAVMAGVAVGGLVISVRGIVESMRGGPDPELRHAEVASLLVRYSGTMLAVIAVPVWLADVPLLFFGIGRHPPSFVPVALAVGAGLGVAVFVASLGLSPALQRLGFEHDYRWLEQLVPRTRREWTLYVGAVLPLVVLAEEVIYRGVLIGVAFPFVAMALPFPHAVTVVGSSALFGLVHANQGRAGILITGLVGLTLGTAFVVVDSLLLVVAAHYVANAAAAVFNARYSEDVRPLGAERSQPLE